MFQTSISGLYIDRKTGEPVVLLQEVDGSRSVPIWLRLNNEMLALAIELAGEAYRLPRPLCHDLVKQVISRLDVRVDRAVITDLEDGIYRARLILISDSGPLEVDARPSDAIILAHKFDAPIFVAEAAEEKHRQQTQHAGQTQQDLLRRFQQIRPEDLSRMS